MIRASLPPPAERDPTIFRLLQARHLAKRSVLWRVRSSPQGRTRSPQSTHNTPQHNHYARAQGTHLKTQAPSPQTTPEARHKTGPSHADKCRSPHPIGHRHIQGAQASQTFGVGDAAATLGAKRALTRIEAALHVRNRCSEHLAGDNVRFANAPTRHLYGAIAQRAAMAYPCGARPVLRTPGGPTPTLKSGVGRGEERAEESLWMIFSATINLSGTKRVVTIKSTHAAESTARGHAM